MMLTAEKLEAMVSEVDAAKRLSRDLSILRMRAIYNDSCPDCGGKTVVQKRWYSWLSGAQKCKCSKCGACHERLKDPHDL